MGCLRRLGCLVLLLAAALVAGFLFRDRLAALYHRLRGSRAAAPVAYAAPAPGSAARAGAALDGLTRRGGPAYVDLSAAELAGLVAREVSPGPRPVLDSVAVALDSGRVEVRGSVDVAVVPREVLGPLAGGLGARQRVTAAGTLSVAEGQVWWTVDAVHIGDLPVPHAAIPRLLRALGLPGLRGAAIPLPLAAGVGDVRVTPAAVRLYRASAR